LILLFTVLLLSSIFVDVIILFCAFINDIDAVLFVELFAGIKFDVFNIIIGWLD
jgi:hypothetical protein